MSKRILFLHFITSGGCPGRAMIQSALRVHFLHRPMLYTIVVLEEGNHLLQHCPKCDMCFLWELLKQRHMDKAMCAKGEERKCSRRVEEEAQARNMVSFPAYESPLEKVASFKYIGWVLSERRRRAKVPCRMLQRSGGLPPPLTKSRIISLSYYVP